MIRGYVGLATMDTSSSTCKTNGPDFQPSVLRSIYIMIERTSTSTSMPHNSCFHGPSIGPVDRAGFMTRRQCNRWQALFKSSFMNCSEPIFCRRASGESCQAQTISFSAEMMLPLAFTRNCYARMPVRAKRLIRAFWRLSSADRL